MKQNEFYCVAIRKRVTQRDEDIGVVMMKNKKIPQGVPALRSHHAKSDSTMYKFIPHASYDRMLSKYGKY